MPIAAAGIRDWVVGICARIGPSDQGEAGLEHTTEVSAGLDTTHLAEAGQHVDSRPEIAYVEDGQE